MTPIEFCRWLQGYFEVSGAQTLTDAQVKVIKEHLQLVFVKVTQAPAKALGPELVAALERAKKEMTKATLDKMRDDVPWPRSRERPKYC